MAGALAAYPLRILARKMDTAVLMHSTMEGSGKPLVLRRDGTPAMVSIPPRLGGPS